MPNGRRSNPLIDYLNSALDRATVRRDVGTTHEVRGEIDELDDECPPLAEIAGAELHLAIFYLVGDGDGWRVPREKYDPSQPGHVPLVTEGNTLLEQGVRVATTTIEDDGSVGFSWAEAVREDRTPYLRARPVSPAFEDPDDPTGYQLTDIKRVYRLSQFIPVGGNTFLQLSPVIELEFWGEETSKTLPRLRGRCFDLWG